MMFGITPYNRRNNEIQKGIRDIFDIESVFDNFFGDSFFPSLYGMNSQMKVDIRDTGNEYVIDAELPGVSKDEINLELRDDRLTISVNRNEETRDERENYIRRERRASSVSRSFILDNVKQEDVKAKFENGVLSIRLPKVEVTKSKQYKIDIN